MPTMVEQQAEVLKTPEQAKTSPALMLHIANGEFDTEKLSSLKKNPSEIADVLYASLEAKHKRAQQKQQEEQYKRIRETALEGIPEEKITPEILRHFHMVAWAKTESIRVGLLLRKQKENPEGQKAIMKALKALDIVINDDTDVSNLAHQFYKTTSDVSGIPGTFYQSFCNGNLNKNLLDALQEEDIVVLKDFLADTLGSYTAYEALLATKQTQNALSASQDFSQSGVAIRPNEQPVLAFFQEGKALLGPNYKPKTTEYSRQEPPIKESALLRLRTDMDSEKNPDHPDRNEDAWFAHPGLLSGGIFDGAGGYAGGDKASEAAKDTAARVLAAKTIPDADTEEIAKANILEALHEANEAVKKVGGKTTAALYQVVQGKESKKLIVGSVGDSRVWIKKSNGDIVQVSKDWNNIRSAYLTNEEEYQRISNIIDNATSEADLASLSEMQKIAFWKRRNETALLGSEHFDPEKHIGIFEADIAEGDTIFLTTDGVHDNLTTKEIEQIAKESTSEIDLAKKLVARAKAVADTYGKNDQLFRAKPDDITAIAAMLSLRKEEPIQHTKPVSRPDTIEGMGNAIAENMQEGTTARVNAIISSIESLLQKDQPNQKELAKYLNEYRSFTGIPFYSTYNTHSPNWISPYLETLPPSEQSRQLTQVLNNINSESVNGPFQSSEQLRFYLSPQGLQETFGISSQTVTDILVDRQITEHAIELINIKLREKGWSVSAIQPSGEGVRLVLQRIPRNQS